MKKCNRCNNFKNLTEFSKNKRKFDGLLDHIKPLASFDLEDREEFLKACHFSNLQPLWAKENWSKGSRNV